MLFCLAGAVAVFDGDRIAASTSRLAWGGAAFGFAGAVKAWAIVPVLVIAVLCLPGLRRAAVFAAGAAAGFVVPVLPFVLAAPRPFYNDVFVAQLARIGASTPVWHRLESMLGFPPGIRPWPHGTVLAACAALVAFVIITQAVAWRITRRPPPPLDWFATLTAALVVAMFLWPPYFAGHYSAFLAPFLALALALPVSRLAGSGAAATAHRAEPARNPWPARAGLAALSLAIVAGAALQAPPHPRLARPTAADRVVPRGACVATDQAAFLLLANRFSSDVPGCTQMVDGLGTDLALSGGHRPGRGAGRVPAVAAAWRQAFSHAGFVLLSRENTLRIAWTPGLLAYFHGNFRPVLYTPGFTVYARSRA
jgi:hypothetical protein